jgi:alkylation response protein AidB-like acyl-CoA dehydrogenase
MPLKVADFKLPEEYDRYLEAVKEFTDVELEKYAVEMEKSKRLPDEIHPLLRDAGLLRLRLPKKYGGLGLSFTQYYPIMKTVARSHGSIRMIVHDFNGTWRMIDQYGTEEQKEEWFKRIWLAGVEYPAFSLTEPDSGTGVDIRTTARREGDHYIINGKKHLITYANIGNPFFVVAYTGDRSLGAKGISVILVERGTPGFTIEAQREMMGLRGCYHGVLNFNDCKVPVSNILGKEGEGLEIALRTFVDDSRLSIAASILGSCEKLLDLAVEHAYRRVTFGKPLADRPIIQNMIANMATDIYATECMIADCARLFDNNEDSVVQAAMCKQFAIDMSQRVSDYTLQVFGGVGYTSEYPVERIYRDLRAPWFEEGSSTILRLIVGRDALGKQVRQIGK